ncbi:hypothetical protein HYH03_014961 [Edaphochlamys debaryana]|uniref:Peptidase M11 gametolysin domain-containing protein n=1 Tax=Edaphochlamys debaryana TaxID=47281 RepID=A0A835XQF3_9CHLO|nr:hypothetical protein HYH03_014961 [Edaphochlamys debaryana]|eukprot:KAG2486381.1 hypothetical protein HYH03_014961 [Edaphochlamys debaryana]
MADSLLTRVRDRGPCCPPPRRQTANARPRASGVEVRVLISVVRTCCGCESGLPPSGDGLVEEVSFRFFGPAGYARQLRNCSYQQFNISATGSQVIEVPLDCSDAILTCDFPTIAARARGLAPGLLVDGALLSSFTHMMYVLPPDCFGEGCPSGPELFRLGWARVLANLSSSTLAEGGASRWFALRPTHVGPTGAVLRVQPDWMGAAYTKNVFLTLRARGGGDANLFDSFSWRLSVHEALASIDNSASAEGDPRIDLRRVMDTNQAFNMTEHRLVLRTRNLITVYGEPTPLLEVLVCRYRTAPSECTVPQPACLPLVGYTVTWDADHALDDIRSLTGGLSSPATSQPYATISSTPEAAVPTPAHAATIAAPAAVPATPIPAATLTATTVTSSTFPFASTAASAPLPGASETPTTQAAAAALAGTPEAAASPAPFTTTAPPTEAASQPAIPSTTEPASPVAKPPSPPPGCVDTASWCTAVGDKLFRGDCGDGDGIPDSACREAATGLLSVRLSNQSCALSLNVSASACPNAFYVRTVIRPNPVRPGSNGGGGFPAVSYYRFRLSQDPGVCVTLLPPAPRVLVGASLGAMTAGFQANTTYFPLGPRACAEGDDTQVFFLLTAPRSAATGIGTPGGDPWFSVRPKTWPLGALQVFGNPLFPTDRAAVTGSMARVHTASDMRYWPREAGLAFALPGFLNTSIDDVACGDPAGDPSTWRVRRSTDMCQELRGVTWATCPPAFAAVVQSMRVTYPRTWGDNTTCLEASSGMRNMRQWACDEGRGNQSFIFERIPDFVTPVPYYYLRLGSAPDRCILANNDTRYEDLVYPNTGSLLSNYSYHPVYERPCNATPMTQFLVGLHVANLDYFDAGLQQSIFASRQRIRQKSRDFDLMVLFQAASNGMYLNWQDVDEADTRYADRFDLRIANDLAFDDLGTCNRPDHSWCGGPGQELLDGLHCEDDGLADLACVDVWGTRMDFDWVTPQLALSSRMNCEEVQSSMDCNAERDAGPVTQPEPPWIRDCQDFAFWCHNPGDVLFKGDCFDSDGFTDFACREAATGQVHVRLSSNWCREEVNVDANKCPTAFWLRTVTGIRPNTNTTSPKCLVALTAGPNMAQADCLSFDLNQAFLLQPEGSQWGLAAGGGVVTYFRIRLSESRAAQSTCLTVLPPRTYSSGSFPGATGSNVPLYSIRPATRPLDALDVIQGLGSAGAWVQVARGALPGTAGAARQQFAIPALAGMGGCRPHPSWCDTAGGFTLIEGVDCDGDGLADAVCRRAADGSVHLQRSVDMCHQLQDPPEDACPSVLDFISLQPRYFVARPSTASGSPAPADVCLTASPTKRNVTAASFPGAVEALAYWPVDPLTCNYSPTNTRQIFSVTPWDVNAVAPVSVGTRYLRMQPIAAPAQASLSVMWSLQTGGAWAHLLESSSALSSMQLLMQGLGTLRCSRPDTNWCSAYGGLGLIENIDCGECKLKGREGAVIEPFRT